ncbi:MAG: epimerase, partial [Bacilli bacterium]
FISSDEASLFLAYLATSPIKGAINGSSNQSISLRKVIEYTQSQVNTKAILNDKGLVGPYNNRPSYTINTSIALKHGFKFKDIESYIYNLIDDLIKENT